jgi:hypothetical protein
MADVEWRGREQDVRRWVTVCPGRPIGNVPRHNGIEYNRWICLALYEYLGVPPSHFGRFRGTTGRGAPGILSAEIDDSVLVPHQHPPVQVEADAFAM